MTRASRRSHLPGRTTRQGQDILVAAGNPAGIHGPQDLRDKTVCTIAGSSYGAVISQYAVTLSGAAFRRGMPARGQRREHRGGHRRRRDPGGTRRHQPGQVPGARQSRSPPIPRESPWPHDDDKFRSFINDVLEQSFGDGTWKKSWDADRGDRAGRRPPAAGESLLKRPQTANGSVTTAVFG